MLKLKERSRPALKEKCGKWVSCHNLGSYFAGFTVL